MKYIQFQGKSSKWKLGVISYKVKKKTRTAGYEVQRKAVSPKPEEDERNM